MFLLAAKEELCSDCRRRRERNPLRVLDCKVPSCRLAMADAPSILDHLCPECSRHFEAVKHALEKFKVSFVVDKRLVRGLDYYTRTTFEIVGEKELEEKAVILRNMTTKEQLSVPLDNLVKAVIDKIS